MRWLNLNFILNEKKIEIDFSGFMLIWGAASAVTYIVLTLGEMYL